MGMRSFPAQGTTCRYGGPTAQKPGEHSRTPVYIPKYKFTSQDVVLFKDPVYFRKIREVLISIDDHSHKDVYDEAQN